MSDAPSANGGNGRDSRGRFAAGNKHSKGNPLGGAVSRMRSEMLKAVTEGDLETIVGVLVTRAKEGDLAAIKLLLSYAVGKPVDHEAMDRMDANRESAQKYKDFMAGEISIDELL